MVAPEEGRRLAAVAVAHGEPEDDAGVTNRKKQQQQHDPEDDSNRSGGTSSDNDDDSSSQCSQSSIVQENLLLVQPPPDHPTHDGTGVDDYDDPWYIACIKNVVSACLLVFCFVLLVAAMFTKQTRATSAKSPHQLSPALAFVLFLCALAWLAVIEGSLNCMVGLRPLDKKLFCHSHPIAHRASRLCQGQHGHNLERFIVGRQYMDLTMVFSISFLATADKGAVVLGLPPLVCSIFLNTGIAMTLVTIVLGQLVLQINAAHCMLDYMNNYVMLTSTYLALFMEATGVCHIVYLVQRIAVWMNNKANNNNNNNKADNSKADNSKDTSTTPAAIVLTTAHHDKQHHTVHTRSAWQEVLFWVRVLFSTAMLCFSLVTVVVATLNGDTKIWEGVPAWASILLFFALVFLVGMMDALQIALMAVVHMPREQLLLHRRGTAAANADYVVFSQRLPSFLLGRQIGQTVIQFLLTRLLTLDVPVGVGENIWGVSDFWQKVFNTGGLGAIIATVLASLCWRVLASEFPLMFLSSPFARPVIALCLAAERTGIINISWSLAALQRKVLGMHTDETYLGSKAAALVLTPSTSTSSISDNKETTGANDLGDDNNSSTYNNNNNNDIEDCTCSGEEAAAAATADDLITAQQTAADAAAAINLDQLEIEIDHERSECARTHIIPFQKQ